MKQNSNSKAGTTSDSSTKDDGEFRLATLVQNPCYVPFLFGL